MTSSTRPLFFRSLIAEVIFEVEEACAILNALYQPNNTLPTTILPEGVFRVSKLLFRQASVKNFIVVSKLILRVGEVLCCMPALLIGVMVPCMVM